MNWNNWLYADRLGEEKQTTKPQTNADRIRAMSDDELAEWLCDNRHCVVPKDCPGHTACRRGSGKANGLKTWLKQPAEE